MRIFSGNFEGVRWEDFRKFDELRRFDSDTESSLRLVEPQIVALKPANFSKQYKHEQDLQ